MSERARKVAVSLLLAVFALFVGANTLCLHIHVSDGAIVSHSHPYLPSAHHSHSGAQLAGIALVNSMAFDDSVSFPDFCSAPMLMVVSGVVSDVIGCLCANYFDTACRRGPPVL